MTSYTFLKLLNPIKEKSVNNCEFLKFTSTVRSVHCDR